ncbi:MAG: YcfL family protein [Puniceicoccales bacterium]|jgi:uncharacterized protein YcfL|nr:YcfL family protein [Puniceicoccales bacterium]
MNTQHRFSAVLLAAAAFASAGCSSTVNTVESANPSAQVTPEQMKHITSDSSLDSIVKPIFLNIGKADDGESLKVQLTVKNTKQGKARVHYRVEWKDAQGLALSGYTSTLQTIHLLGAEEKPIITIAPSPRAKDFRFVFISSESE